MSKRKFSIDISIIQEKDIINKKSKNYKEIPIIDLENLDIKDIIDYGGCSLIYDADYKNNQVILKKVNQKIGKHHYYALKILYNSDCKNILKPIGISSCRRYITYPFIEGQTLCYEVFKKDNYNNNIIKGLINCVYELHSLNLIHSDIKPNNFILKEDNSVIMIDIDNIIPVINEKPITHCLYPQYGTIGFRKPLNKIITFEDDFWSLGATIYNLYSNKVPYEDYINNYNSLTDIDKQKYLTKCYFTKNIDYNCLNNRLNQKVLEKLFN